MRLLRLVLCFAVAAAHFSAAAAEAPPSTAAEQITLEPGEIRSIPLGAGITRVLVENPQVLDVQMLSANELLLQAKQAGSTRLLFWDGHGQHASAVDVVNAVLERDLMQVLQKVNLPGVELKREAGKYFLVGQVPSGEDMGRLEQVLGALGGKVTNLVTPAPPPPPPPPQPVKSVTLTVQLVEMSRDSTDGFGVDWTTSVDGLTITESPLTSGKPGGGLSEAVAAFGESLRLGTLSRTESISGIINFLASKGKARILAEPKLVAGSGKKATTRLGVEFPIVTTTVNNGVSSEQVEFKNVGVDMSFQPTILPDEDKIQLVLNTRVTSIASAAAVGNIPSFRVRQTDTEIFTKRGETIIIAGLLQDEERNSISQIPGIGSIPGFGNLFRSTDKTTAQTELVVLVTPDFVVDEAETADKAFALEQSLARAELSGSVNDPTLRYVIQIQDRIAKALRYPQREKELGIDGRVKLKLHVFRDGTLGQATIAESSGIESLDAEALKAAETQAPYPPFPTDFTQQDLWMELPVLFRP